MSAPQQHRKHLGKPPPRNLPLAALVLLLILLLGGGAAAGGWWGGTNVVYAARLAGTPGRYLVDHCEPHGTGRQRHVVCHGVFQTDDGRRLSAGSISTGEHWAGDRLPMQYHGGSLNQVGVAPVAGWTILLAFAVAALSGALQLLTVGVEFAAPVAGRRLRRAAWAVRARGIIASGGSGALGVALVAGAVFLVASLATKWS
ncbi:hypothetical protein LN042_32115 [Kitasatospora sp. RB6PN24]|uniref:hypothetical protein n=1 Tax=Kitasatospora humi TaxID=2893891 RepID=UPI001E426114|nr:hypothetical protein [Kitasatospora humi]MCC9311659.1 hypothetical protein [Kitasatospora humi]